MGALPMGMSDERERAAEARFAQEREFAFRLAAHRNRLVARWAAIKMGLPCEHADRYATQFVANSLGEGDETVLLNRLHADFLSHGVVVPLEDIRVHLDNFAKISLKELSSDTRD
jgi:hypothetical protein